jgi:hypothetical protein
MWQLKTDSLKFHPVPRDRLYYDQWQYSMTLYLSEISCLRDLDHERINHLIEVRRQWRQHQQQRWARSQIGLINTIRHKEINDQIINDLHAVASVLLEHTAKFKTVFSTNTMWIYTNDTSLLQQLTQLPCVDQVKLAEALVQKPRGAMVLKNPQHTHRSYFRSKKLTMEQKQTLKQFLQNHKSCLRTGPALENWLQDRFLRSQDYFFVDHNGESWLTMLGLVQPGLVRKTMQIKQAK